MKRDGEGFGDARNPKQGRRDLGQYAFKVLCPEPMVVKLMEGKGGPVHQIENQTSTHLQFSPRGDFFPETRFRILTILGHDPSCIYNALMEMVEQVVQRGAEEHEAGKTGEFLDDRGRVVFRCALSKAGAGAVIGSKGDRVKKLRETSGAHIAIDRVVAGNHQLVSVYGSREQLNYVIEELNQTVQADANEAWFKEWAGQRSVPSDGKGGAGGPPRGRRDGDDGHRGDGGGHRERDHGDFRDADEGGRRPRTDHSSLKHRGCTIFVGRLAKEATTKTLQAHFEQFGEVVDADVRTDPTTGRSKGFGFITFSDPSSVEACLDVKAEQNIDGRWVDVKRYGENAEDGHGEHHDEPRGGGGGARVGGRYFNSPPRHHGGDLDDRGRGDRGRGDHGRGDHGRGDHDRGDHGRGDHDRGDHGRGGFGGRGRPSDFHATIPWFGDLASQINPDYLGLKYCITCSLPSVKCGAIIGRGGQTITDVQRSTGAEITVSKKDPHESDDAHRTVTLTGPLLSVYGAHMLLMRHYNDDEAQFQAHRHHDPGEQRAEDLQRQVEQLKSKLASARSHEGGGRGHEGGRRDEGRGGFGSGSSGGCGGGPRVPMQRR